MATPPNTAAARVPARPQTVLQRTQAKISIAASRLITQRLEASIGASQMYASARRTRVNQRYGPETGSAQQHLDWGLHATIRQDCQAAARDNSVARAFIKRKADLDVGDGPIVTSASSDPEWNAKADEWFSEWWEGRRLDRPVDVRGCDSGPELLRKIDRAWETDGDIIAIFTKDGSLQLVESERLGGQGWKTPAGVPAAQYRAGVEMDRTGRPVKYWIADWNTTGTAAQATLTSYPAESAELLKNPSDDIVGLVRGEPGLQAALDQLERLDAVIEKTALAVEIATLFGLVIKTERPAETQAAFEATTTQTETDTAKPGRADIQPAGMLHLGLNESAEQLKPEQPSANFREFITAQMLIIAADLGVPLAASHFDAAGMSWSNIKALMAIAMRGVEARQARLERFLRRVREWRLRMAIEQGELPAPPSAADIRKVAIQFPLAPVLDFESEVAGGRAAVEGGLATRDQVTQRLGTGRSADIDRGLAEEQTRARELGVVITGTPGASTGTGAAADPATARNARTVRAAARQA